MLVPLGALLTVVAALATTWDTGALEASETHQDDADSDGIPDAYESVLMTSSVRADSDDDGYCDSEELARQSDTGNARSVPTNTGLSVGMTARGGGGALHLLVAMYYTDRRTDNKVMRFGMRGAGGLVSVPMSTLTEHSSVRVVGRPEGGDVMLVDIAVPPTLIAAGGSASFFVVVGEVGNPRYSAAAVVDVILSDGIPILCKRSGAATGIDQDPEAPDPPNATFNALFVPIPFNGTSEIPLTWEGGRICFRTIETIGGSGAILTHEVVSAECKPGFDSHCDANCANSVGRTFETVDPVTLVGG